MRSLVNVLAILVFLFSCGPNNREKKLKKMQDSIKVAAEKEAEQIAKNQQAYYKNRELVLDAFYELKYQKGFSFYCTDNCAEGGKIYYNVKDDEQRKPHLVSMSADEDSLYVGFSISAECYSEFVADLKNENDTLKLLYSVMNPGYRDCFCKYRWLYSVSSKKEKYSVVTLNGQVVRNH